MNGEAVTRSLATRTLHRRAPSRPLPASSLLARGSSSGGSWLTRSSPAPRCPGDVRRTGSMGAPHRPPTEVRLDTRRVS